MTNVSVDSSIMIFRDEGPAIDHTTEILCPDYLRRREFAERAAAKRSQDIAARRIHQQLAESYAARRRREDSSRYE